MASFFILDFRCDFERDNCNIYLLQLTTDNFNWTRINDTTPTEETGPIEGQLTENQGNVFFSIRKNSKLRNKTRKEERERVTLVLICCKYKLAVVEVVI